MDGLLFSFILGIFTSPWIDPTWPLWLLPAGATIFWGSVWAWQRICPCKQQVQQQLTVFTCLILGVLCGMQWSLINAKSTLSWNLPESYLRQTISVPIRITSIVEDNGQRLRFNAEVVALAAHSKAPETAALRPGMKLRLQWYGSQWHYGVEPSSPMPTVINTPQLGDIWYAQLRLRPVSGLHNQVGFNYQAWLTRQQVGATGYVQHGELIAGNRLAKRPIDALRQRIFDQFSARKPWLQHADILLALAIAERQWVSPDTWQVLQRTGVAHLMAISGLHLSMVFAASTWLLRWWLAALVRLLAPRWQGNIWPAAIVLGWLCALGYAALADFAVATLRALLLISVFIILRFYASHVSPLRVLIRAVALVLLLDPMAWLDAGFWLSCLAVSAIFLWLWHRPAQGLIGWRAKTLQLWRFELMLCVMLMPITVAYFQGVSWLAPLVNLLVVPVFSLMILPLTLLALLLLPIWPVLASTLLSVADTVVSWVWWGLQGLSEIAFVDTHHVVGAWLLVLILGVRHLPVQRHWRWLWALQLSVSWALLTLVQPRVGQLADPRLWLHMLDVGQGSALVVERQRRAILYDTGPGYQGSHQGHSVIEPFLRRRGLDLDMIVLSHPHWDHIGGADYLLTRYPNALLLDTDGRGLPCQWGQVWGWQGVTLRALAPLPMAVFQGVNNQSCVLQLSFQGRQVLLPGDIERLGEFRLVRYYQQRLQSDVMLVPHHGSRTSSHPYLLNQVQPHIGLISSGYLNRFNMPHPEAIARLEAAKVTLYNTAWDGQVSVLWYRQRWHIRTQRGDFSPYWFNQTR